MNAQEELRVKAHALANRIKKLRAPSEAEMKDIIAAHTTNQDAWQKKWAETLQETDQMMKELQESCPHDWSIEMSFKSCNICGMSVSRSH